VHKYNGAKGFLQGYRYFNTKYLLFVVYLNS